MRILHFSDFHLKPGNGLRKSQELLDKMMSSLDTIQQEHPIDLVIFSGDMIDRGAEGFTSMAIAFGNFKFLVADKIAKHLNISADRIIIAPGNHDIDKKADKQHLETGIYEHLCTIKDVDNFISDPTNFDDVKRIAEFNKFQEGYYNGLSGLEYYHTPLQSNIIITIDGKKVGITILNSVWRCYDSKMDKGRILIGQSQIIDSEKYLDTCDVKLAVSHHDYNWVRDFERLNLSKLITKNYNMFFCGHTHGADAELVCRPEGNTFFFTAPGLLHANVHELDGNYKNGYMIIDYNVDEHTVRASRYVQDYDKTFKLDNGESGVWEHEIPRGEVAKRNERLMNTYNQLQSSIPKLNSHLIGYRTSTLAPKTIEDIFVMPRLSYKEQSDNEMQSVKTIGIRSIDELLQIEGNIILYGDKESGKTILLDKILIELTINYRAKNIIPAALRFSAINNNILTLVSSYWDLRVKDAKELLLEKNIVLLIDDIDFEEESSTKVSEIVEFLNKYPRIRLIGTAFGGHSIVCYGPNNISIPSSKRIQIDSFRAEEIRSLACKWYQVPEDNHDLREKMEFIINAFSTFKLPCTPFSVTLLLWILEKGGQIQPTNSAILLDTFMMEMLKDYGKGYGKERFNQLNKIRLLSSIAFAIYQEEVNSTKEGRSYAFTMGKLISLVEKHLSAMEMPTYHPIKIVEELIDAGVLVQEGVSNVIYFRFRCFMEYFLAKQMIVSEDFFKHVLSEQNYLDFANVINYYTGFTSDKISVLNKIITRLEIEYIDLNRLLDTTINIDDYFIRKGLLEAIENPDLKYLSPEKHSVEKDNKRSNIRLLHCEKHVAKGDHKRPHVSSFRVYSELLRLAMDVLKNTEESEETGHILKLDENEKRTKSSCYNIVLECSITFAIIFYIMCMRYIKDNESDPTKEEKIKELTLIMFLLPVIHEEFLRNHLGSVKLIGAVKDKMDADKAGSSSELQRFMSVFLYGDLKGKDYIKIIKVFLSSAKRAYIRDSAFFKLQQYFYDSNDKELDWSLAEMMADLYIASHKTSNKKGDFNKGAIINEFLNKKRCKR